MWKPYKQNIAIEPISKNKIIGDTSKFYLIGKVIGVGSEVKDIKVGDKIGYTLWGLTEILDEQGVRHMFIKDDPDFILGVYEE